MPFKFAVITVVHANAAEDSRLKLELIRQADACLHRRNAGVRGDLFFVGVDFDDDAAFRELLKNYGMAGAEIALPPPIPIFNVITTNADGRRACVKRRLHASGLGDYNLNR